MFGEGKASLKLKPLWGEEGGWIDRHNTHPTHPEIPLEMRERVEPS